MPSGERTAREQRAWEFISKCFEEKRLTQPEMLSAFAATETERYRLALEEAEKVLAIVETTGLIEVKDLRAALARIRKELEK